MSREKYRYIINYIIKYFAAEFQLQQGLEELTMQIQCKDQKLESDSIKCASLFNTVQEYKKQLKSLKDALDTERSTKNGLEEQIQAYA